MDALKELVQFMDLNQRLDLKAVALTHVLGLTGSADGKAIVLGLDDLLVALLNLTRDQNHTIAKDAVLSIINLTAEQTGAIKIFSLAEKQESYDIVKEALKQITDENSGLADPWCMVLCNLTRFESLVHSIFHELAKDSYSFSLLLRAFDKLEHTNKNSKLHYLGPLFCNLTQIDEGRKMFCDPNNNYIDKLLPFISYNESLIRRGGIIGILKNICFDQNCHTLLLMEKEEVLPAMLYPLCGPEEFDDEDNEKLPIELQYLPESKTREEDPDLRKMILESLLQLCATKKFREFLRSKGVYEILREYHRWEEKFGKDKECLLACENVVDILIKKEDEIGLDNYKNVEIPANLVDDFVKEDAAYINDS